MRNYTNSYIAESVNTVPFVEYTDAYRLGDLGYCPEYNKACYYVTPATVNDDPVLVYTADLMNHCSVNITDVVMTPAPDLYEAVEFLRSKYNVYIRAYKLTNPEKAEDGSFAYKTTGKYGCQINIFDNEHLIGMVSNNEIGYTDAGDSSDIKYGKTYDTYYEALYDAIRFAIAMLYRDLEETEEVKE